MQLLEYRRINWKVVAIDRIQWEFESFIRVARTAGFPFEFRFRQDDVPNENVITVSAERSFIGIVDRTHTALWEQPTFQDTQVVETGGELVVSQAASGFIHFIVYPRRSDRLKPVKKELLLFSPIDPVEITPRLVRKVIRRYLLVLQDSSTFGSEDALTFLERVMVSWLYFRELRSRNEFYRSMLGLRNEWGKAIVAGVVAFVIGYIAGGPSPNNPSPQLQQSTQRNK